MAVENQLAAELDDPRFGIGGNQPPLSERITLELAPLLDKRAELLAIAETAVIIDEESARKVTDLGKLMRAFELGVDSTRDAMMRPYLEATRQINAAFNPIAGPVAIARQGADGRGGLRGMLTRWLAKREEEAQAERDRLAAEQRTREAEAEAARRTVEEKKQAGGAGIADELAVLQAEEAVTRLGRQAAAIRPEPVRAQLGTVGAKREIAFTITDLRKVLGWTLKSSLKGQIEASVTTIIGRHLRSLGVASVERSPPNIPGLETRIEKIAQVR